MKVVYVCGYGRSGSTTLGELLAAERGGVGLGEAHQVARGAFLSRARCACGAPYPECDYWGRVDARLLTIPRTRLLVPVRAGVLVESFLGLLLPMVVLRGLSGRLSFSERYRGVSYRSGVAVLVDAAGGLVVDTSKTTRLTGNRPRLLRAAGVDVELLLGRRPRAEVTRSYRAAGERRSVRRGALRTWVAPAVGRVTASAAATWCAWSLGRPLTRVSLEDTVTWAATRRAPDPQVQHSIAGNRSRLQDSAGARP